MKRLFNLLHWVNLDTAIGAVITSAFIAECLNSRIPVEASITLFLAVLSIYNFDHLMDARKMKAKAQTARHRFYQDNMKKLSIYQLLLMAGLITIIWYLPAAIIRAGIVLALTTGIYFILLFFVFPSRFMLKEIMIALVYSLALFLAPVYINEQISLHPDAVILFFEILLLAVSNTLIFSWYDLDSDLNDGHTSLARNLGKAAVFKVVVFALAILSLLTIYQATTTGQYFEQMLILIMTLILLYVLMAQKKLSNKERFRVAGDAVFFVPIFKLLI